MSYLIIAGDFDINIDGHPGVGLLAFDLLQECVGHLGWLVQVHRQSTGVIPTGVQIEPDTLFAHEVQDGRRQSPAVSRSGRL